ncbi:MAG: methionyl-tRNA formyltransferase [Psychrobacter glaciei]
MRIVFAGTPGFAATHLKALLKAGIDVVGVYTQPDRPSGRGKKLTASPVKVLAAENGIEVFQPVNFKQESDREQLARLKPDLMIVVAYGLLLPQTVLDIPTHGCINSHASLLPRWRGAAPIQRAIEAGDLSSGVTVMQMEAGLDTGPMIQKIETPIMPSDTGGSLHDRLAELGSQAIVNTVRKFENGPVLKEIQDDSQTCYARKLTKDEALINWHQSAEVIVQTIRAFNPAPMCYTLLGDSRIRVLKAQLYPKSHYSIPGTVLSVNSLGIIVACKENAVVLEQVTIPGKKPMMVSDLLNGNHPFIENYVLASEQ